jgi:hypothetical protein
MNEKSENKDNQKEEEGKIRRYAEGANRYYNPPDMILGYYPAFFAVVPSYPILKEDNDKKGIYKPDPQS